VHRDLKPENVMVDATARRSSWTSGSRGRCRDRHGHGAGTVMARSSTWRLSRPQGQVVDQRADIYAFGLILYDLLGGRWRASKYETPMSELMARLTQPLPRSR